MIHGSGPRAEGPFVPVNCGAIPSELMESEFFGHKRGSFTGAVTDKVGLIPSAEGGTLFLDEVADLPLHMQVKLLRVIQEKTVRPDRRTARSADRRAHPVRHPQESRRPGGAGEISRRPVLSHQRHRAARAARCASAPRTFPIWPMPSCAGCRAGWAWTRRRSRRRRSTCCRIPVSRQRARAGERAGARAGVVQRGTHRGGRFAAARRAARRTRHRHRPMAIAAMRSSSATSNAAERTAGRPARSAISSRTWSAPPSSRRWKRRATTRPPRPRRWA